MKRWQIILIVTSILLLLTTLGIFSFGLDKLSNWWFYGTLIGLSLLALIGVIIYKLRSLKTPINEDKKDEKKIKSTKELVQYAKNLLIESDEANYLKNIMTRGYVAGQTTKSAVRKEYGIVIAEGLFYVKMYDFAVYIIAINVREPEEHFIEIVKKADWDKNNIEVSKRVMEQLEKTADIPREDTKVIQRTINPYGGVTETITSQPSKHKDDEEKESVETLEKKPDVKV